MKMVTIAPQRMAANYKNCKIATNSREMLNIGQNWSELPWDFRTLPKTKKMAIQPSFFRPGSLPPNDHPHRRAETIVSGRWTSRGRLNNPERSLTLTSSWSKASSGLKHIKTFLFMVNSLFPHFQVHLSIPCTTKYYFHSMFWPFWRKMWGCVLLTGCNSPMSTLSLIC